MFAIPRVKFLTVFLSFLALTPFARAQTDLVVGPKTYNSGQTATEAATNTVSTQDAVAVNSGATVTFAAVNRITLSPGFQAFAGSAFTAKIAFFTDPGDLDNDGMSDEWERTNFGNTSTSPLADPDGDGLSNVAEYNLGRNPNAYNQGTSTLGNAIPAGWSLLAAAHPDIPANIVVGTTAGSLSVDKSGAATYSIPLWVSPGTAGMQPQLALNYSSQSGSGIAGFGWSLSGVSAISRGPKTLAVDGIVRPVKFDREDPYYFDGQRLIYVGGQAHGYAEAEYRTEIESFSRAVAQSAAGNGPESFRVWTRSGLIVEFGGTPDSRLYANDGVGPLAEVYTWSVSKISDSSGNYMTFSYEKDALSSEQRLVRIDYTGHEGAAPSAPYASVRLGYESRDDTSFGYVHGARFARTKRLKHVRAYHGTTDEVRTYTFDYLVRAPSGRSLLQTFTETGSDGKSYPPLGFNYSNPENGLETLNPDTWAPPAPLVIQTASNMAPVASQGCGFLDVDGDGRTDLLHYTYSSAIYPTQPIVDRQTWLNKSGGWIPADGTGGQPDYRLPMVAPLAFGTGAGDVTQTRFADLNGDGLIDVIGTTIPGETLNPGGVHLNTGSGFDPTPTERWRLPWGGPVIEQYQRSYAPGCVYYYVVTRQKQRYSDLNGDGRVDYMGAIKVDTFTEEGEPGVPQSTWYFGEVWLNRGPGPETTEGAAWEHSAAYSIDDYAEYDAHMRMFDVNGDGLPDLVTGGYGYSDQRPVCLNTGQGWSKLAYGTAEYDRYKTPAPFLVTSTLNRIGTELADLNGDGLLDLVCRYTDTSFPANSRNSAFFNTGHGWVAAAAGYLSPYAMGVDVHGQGAAMVDMNSDGILDFVRALGNSNDVRFGTPGGWSGSSATEYFLPQAIMEQVGFRDETRSDLIDLDADGAVDQVWHRVDRTVWSSPQTYRGAVRNKRVNPDRLVKVTDGLGVKAEIIYQPLTAAGVYTKGTDLSGIAPTEAANVTNVTAPLQVVTRITQDDGVGSTYDLDYAYGELRAHRVRGSLGFGWTSVRDRRTDILNVTEFAQNHPFTGRPVESFAKRDNGAGGTLTESTASYGIKPLNSGATQFVFTRQSTQKSYNLDGTLVSQSTTTTQRGAADAHDDYDPYGNSLHVEVDTGGGYSKTVVSTYDNYVDLTRWFLGRPTRQTVTAAAPGGSPIERISVYTYDSVRGLLLSQVMEPDVTAALINLKLTTTYAYDPFGNKISVAVSGADVTVTDASGTLSAGGTVTRTTATEYDPKGRFPQSTTNAQGHPEYYTYDPNLGTPGSLTDANGLLTSWVYDGFGRKMEEIRADGTHTFIHYRWAHPTQGLGGAKYLVETESTGPVPPVGNEGTGFVPSLTFHDAFGRPFASLSINGDGFIVYQDMAYDAMGRNTGKTNPHFGATNDVYWSGTGGFDVLNRPLSTFTPDDENGTQVVTYDYVGLTTTATDPDPKRRVSRTTKNFQGWTISNTRNETGAGGAPASTVTYAYDAIGNLTATNAAGVITTLAYDLRGQRLQMTDADMGTWQYRYNVFGELIWQKDAKHQITTMAYDNLGRLVGRTERNDADTANETTTWTYDSASAGGAWKGKLYSVSASAPGGYSEIYNYDSLGRPVTVYRTIDTTQYYVTQTYDSLGRPATTIYPTGFRTRNVYNQFGYLKEVRQYLASDDGKPNRQLQGFVYWQADRFAVTGQVAGEFYGNGLVNNRVYSAVTGRLRTATVGKGLELAAPFSIQYLQYTYDQVGNVLTRTDGPTARTESFGYDGLDRLTSQALSGGVSATVTVGYDAKGNITGKSDAGAYAYNGVGPHAISGISGGPLGAQAYDYDANGNMRTGGGRSIAWTSFNQARRIQNTANTIFSEFTFGAGHERVMQTSNTGTTVYVGSLYEKVTGLGGTPLIEHKHYIYTPTGRVAVRTETNAGGLEIRYFHTDGLGSITAVTDEKGAIVKRFAFDAWGKRVTPSTNGVITSATAGGFTRGYTDHEQLDDLGLVHMNGRVYDPMLARFLSADPVVQDLSDSQTYNRYSYCANNPINRTDPTGLTFQEDMEDIKFERAKSFLAREIAAGSKFAELPTSDVRWPDGSPSQSSFASSMLNEGYLNEAFRQSNSAVAPDSGLRTAANILNSIAGTIGHVLPGGAGSLGTMAEILGNIDEHGVFAGTNMTLNPIARALVRGREARTGQGSQWDTIGTDLSVLQRIVAGVDSAASAATVVAPMVRAISSIRGLMAAETTAMRAGQVFEADVLAAQNLAKNTGVWRPTAAQIDSAAFKVIVGDARYTSTGLARGTIMDSVQGGFLEIKGGSSVFDFTYQLRLQTYRSLVESTPYTIQTTRPVSIEFGQWLSRWGGSIQAPP